MNEVRNLTLRFMDQATVHKFVTLASRKGYSVSITREEPWIKVNVTFQNKSERSKFVSAWAKASLVIYE